MDLPAAGPVSPLTNCKPYLAVSLMLEPKVVGYPLTELPKPVGGGPYSPGFQLAGNRILVIRLASNTALNG